MFGSSIPSIGHSDLDSDRYDCEDITRTYKLTEFVGSLITNISGVWTSKGLINKIKQVY